MNKILTAYDDRKGFSLKNRLVMAPMTRSRAIENVPTDLMAEYYGQRAGAGLIITEGTGPTAESLSYPRMPGIFSRQQIKGWKKVTDAVHEGGSKIFVQLMHTGRIGHKDNLPDGSVLVGPSDIKANGQIFTDTKGLQDYSKPVALTTQGVKNIIEGHVTAAYNAMEAGFDGVEIHGANGYLLEQFLNPHINTRVDEYGGNIQRRTKIVLDIARRVAEEIGKERVGIRFSPYSTLGDLPSYLSEDVYQTYHFLAKELSSIGIAYLHIAANEKMSRETLNALRASFEGTVILCNGLTLRTAEEALDEGSADLVAFARLFLANPDLDKRIEQGAELNQLDYATAYTPGPKGYVDYPVL